MKWQGTFEQLQATVHSLGLSGDWADIANGKQFKGKDGAILNWYSSSGTLQFQGKQAAREALQKALSSAVPETGGYSHPPLAARKRRKPRRRSGCLSFMGTIRRLGSSWS